MLCSTIFANTSFDVVFVEIFLLVQCDQILEKRVAQIFPKLPKQYPRYFYLKSDVFQNCLKFLATYLCKKFVTKSFKNRPIWSHWLFLTPLIFFLIKLIIIVTFRGPSSFFHRPQNFEIILFCFILRKLQKTFSAERAGRTDEKMDSSIGHFQPLFLEFPLKNQNKSNFNGNSLSNSTKFSYYRRN